MDAWKHDRAPIPQRNVRHTGFAPPQACAETGDGDASRAEIEALKAEHLRGNDVGEVSPSIDVAQVHGPGLLIEEWKKG